MEDSLYCVCFLFGISVFQVLTVLVVLWCMWRYIFFHGRKQVLFLMTYFWVQIVLLRIVYYFLVTSLAHNFFLFFFVLLLFNYSCPHFSPITLSCPTHLPHPILPAPLVCIHGSFIHVPWLDPSPSFPLFPYLLPCGYCQFVLYFHVSGYILLSCLFCWLGSTYKWDHMVFVFHCLAYFT